MSKDSRMSGFLTSVLSDMCKELSPKLQHWVLDTLHPTILTNEAFYVGNDKDRLDMDVVIEYVDPLLDSLVLFEEVVPSELDNILSMPIEQMVVVIMEHIEAVIGAYNGIAPD